MWNVGGQVPGQGLCEACELASSVEAGGDGEARPGAVGAEAGLALLDTTQS